MCLTDLISGKYRVSISDYTRGKLTQSVIDTYPDWPEHRVNDHVNVAVDELSRTPPAQWIQYNDNWPVHHGDFCQYLGEWDQARLNAEAPDGDGTSFLLSIIYEPENLGSIDRLWNDVGTGWEVIFVFACLTCGQRIGVDQGY